MKSLCSFIVVLALLVGGCTTTRISADGTQTIEEIDYMSVQLLASASIVAWGAASKNGISKADAKAVMTLMDIIEKFHADGSYIDLMAWMPEIKAQIKEPRYQSLAIVMVQLVSYELDKHGISTQIPLPTNNAGKLMQAIRMGVVTALAPYLDSKA